MNDSVTILHSRQTLVTILKWVISIVTASIGALSLLIAIPYITFAKQRRNLLQLPHGPFRNPLLGHIGELPKDISLRPQHAINLTAKYGKEHAFTSLLGPIPVLFVCGPKVAKEVLSSSKHNQKSFLYHFLLPWLGTGLLTSAGEKWKIMRRLTTPAFHFDVLRRFLVVMNEQSDILIERLKGMEGKSFDIFEPITACALDIICETAMGQKVYAQSAKGHAPYVDAVYEMSRLVVQRIETPWLANDFIFSLTSLGRQHAKNLKILHDFSNRVIQERRQIYLAERNKEDAEVKRRPAFLDILLEAQLSEKDISDENIREEVDTFMFEGHDTSSASMSWTIHLLGRHPEIQERLYQEIMDVVGDSTEITHEHISKLNYLEMVIKESLRIYPSVSFIGRVLSDDVVVGGVTIPKGTSTSIGIHVMHHNPNLWDEPEKFDPERWTPENSEGRDPYQYIPFSAGPRNCIGQKFATNEEKVILSKITKNFKITSLVENPRMASELILRPRDGILVQLEPRK